MADHGEMGCLAMAVNDGGVPPILAQKHDAEPSAFTPENLLREAGRQKLITESPIPEICAFDNDCDIVRSPLARGEARLQPRWACYHAELYSFSRGGIELGIVRCAVGASIAVLIAEEMFASVRNLLVSAHVTNQLGRVEREFEEVEADGSEGALQFLAIAADRLRSGFLP